MRKQKLVIAGDSWARGEWGWDSNSKYCVLHRGLEFYLEQDGYDVLNVGTPGGTNEEQVNLITSNTQNNEIIIWFQSDPCRTPWRRKKDFWKNIETLQDFLNFEEECIHECYTKLNKLNRIIYCLGGCFALDKKIKDYKNLKPVISWIPTWLMPEQVFPRCMNQEMDFKNFKSRDNELLDFFKEDNKKYNICWDTHKQERNSEAVGYFWPDGEHINRYGHLKIFDYFKGLGYV